MINLLYGEKSVLGVKGTSSFIRVRELGVERTIERTVGVYGHTAKLRAAGELQRFGDYDAAWVAEDFGHAVESLGDVNGDVGVGGMLYEAHKALQITKSGIWICITVGRQRGVKCIWHRWTLQYAHVRNPNSYRHFSSETGLFGLSFENLNLSEPGSALMPPQF
ncbi:hypothetical protein B0H10DRAFT_1967938 [Mycena sp. CBHHK59/15]|nr:hypothetical protein B0H10DRAFT_1967938 [Mycena sp. CBHHK59/15]